MFVKSNKPIIPINGYKSRLSVSESIQSGTKTLDNSKVRKQVESVNKARMQGSSEKASEMASKLRLASNPKNKQIKPLIRKTTAREYS